MQEKGKLIVIEAGDGSGKATQTKLLKKRLIAAGKKVRQISFPDYDAPSSALAAMYLKGDFGKSAYEVNAYAASIFFAVDRYASFKMKWQKDLANGVWILADRYTTSNMVHQAVKIDDISKRNAFIAWLEDLEYEKLALPRPDLVLFLDMDPKVSSRLIAAREAAKDIHELDRDYLFRCYQVSLQLAAQFGWQHIICSEEKKPLDREKIHEKVYEKVYETFMK